MKEDNRKKQREYMRNYYKNNPIQRAKFIERTKKWRKENPDKRKIQIKLDAVRYREQRSLWAYTRGRKLKSLIIETYGNICACCGEDAIEFLSIDHINGGGHKHRKKTGGGTSFYLWLKRNNYPPGFQVLCYNCNQAKGYYGKCPHQIARESNNNY